MRKKSNYLTRYKNYCQYRDKLYNAILNMMTIEERKTFENDLKHTKMLYFIGCFDFVLFLSLFFYFIK